MELIHPLAENYASAFTSAEPALLASVNRQTIEDHPKAHMLSGHVQGRFLSFISKILQPKNVLEIGTFTGYSALCLAEGMALGGELHTIELREEDAATALEHFNASPFKHQIKLHTGNAKEIIPKLTKPWDLVFIDADKVSYIDYYEMMVPQLSPEGVILADNTFFHGEVLAETISGKNAKAMHSFNEHVNKDTRTEQVMLTLRDGLMMIKLKK